MEMPNDIMDKISALSAGSSSICPIARRESEDGYSVIPDHIFSNSDSICINVHQMVFNSAQHHFHLHDFFEVVYVFKGTCIEETPKRICQMCENDIHLLNTNIPHSIRTTSSEDIVLNFMFRKNYIQDLFFSIPFYEKSDGFFFFNSILNAYAVDSVFAFPHDTQAVSLLQHIITEYVDRKKGYEYAAKCYVGLLFNTLFRETQGESVFQSFDINPEKNQDLMKIMNYMNEHLQDVSLQDMASKLHYTPKYISSLITRNFNTTFRTLRNTLRMERASYYLSRTSFTLDEIADMVGCYDRSHFNKLFKDTFHLTPSTYRKTHTCR